MTEKETDSEAETQNADDKEKSLRQKTERQGEMLNYKENKKVKQKQKE